MSLHLMENPVTAAFRSHMPGYPESGNNRIEKVRFAEGRVWINPAQYFEPVAQDTWEASFGKFKPAQHWLYSRKERTLRLTDVEHYQRICATLVETQALTKRIDDAIEARGGWPLTD